MAKNKKASNKEESKNKSNSYGITSLILGISSIIFCWSVIIGFVAGIMGIIFYVKQKKIYQNGISVGGLVTSIIGLVFSFFYFLIWLMIALISFGSS